MFVKKKLASPSDGLEISVLISKPEDEVKGLVQLVHGMCEHKERYQPFMEYLAENGYASVIHDHRGHGESVRSMADLGYFYDGGYEALVDDIRAVNELAVKELTALSAAKTAQDDAQSAPQTLALPVYLLGHSMGSLAVRAFAKRHDDLIHSLIVCGSPSYNPASAIGKAVAHTYSALAGPKYRSKLVQKLSFGAFNKGIENPTSPNAWVCSDSAVVEAYDRDPFCNFQFTANGFVNLFSLMKDAYDISDWKPRHPDMPIMFISGADDPCLIDKSKFEAAVARMKSAGYTHVTSKLYPGMRHEIMNETGKAEVWADILNFIKS